MVDRVRAEFGHHHQLRSFVFLIILTTGEIGCPVAIDIRR